ncbi:MAG: FHA domain-containing protein [Cystobacterineae bacterium]|nr:FHA domain-containing protein [Cystobacterineae bacterium]
MSDGLQIPEHLWSILELMEQEMGVPKSSLVCQAVFTLARLNGYVVAGQVPLHSIAVEPEPQKLSAQRREEPVVPPLAPPSTRKLIEDTSSRPLSAHPTPLREEATPSRPLNISPPSHFEEPLLHDEEEELREEEEDESTYAEAGVEPELYMAIPGKEPMRIEGDEFIIGRGKTCDCVIESNRVSRQHARITREGDTFFLEDLNSSNGTFFVRKQEGFGKKQENFDKEHEKITTRQSISNEDEFIFGTERVIFYVQ